MLKIARVDSAEVDLDILVGKSAGCDSKNWSATIQTSENVATQKEKRVFMSVIIQSEKHKHFTTGVNNGCQQSQTPQIAATEIISPRAQIVLM